MKRFFIAYAILSLAVIIVKLAGHDQPENYLKPLLMPSLAIFYFIKAKQLKLFDYKILFALIFSTLGDVLLMPLFDLFIPGLLGFMIAHFFYISAFLSERKQSLLSLSGWKKSLLILGTLVYISLLYILYPVLDSTVLKMAIIAYASVLLCLLFAATFRYPKNNASVIFVSTGAFLFLLSDGMIAINKFLFELSLSSLLIMGTYTLAQAFLVYGSLIRNKQIL